MNTRRPLAAVNLAARQHHREREFWMEYLAGEFATAQFPADRPTAQRSKTSAEHSFTIDRKLSETLIRVSGASDLLLQMVLMSGLAVMVHEYTGKEDFLLGTSILQQKRRGDFLNTVLVLRNRICPAATFRKVLRDTRQATEQAFAHQNYPYETLAHQLGSDRDGGLFDIALVLENIQAVSYLDAADAQITFVMQRESDRVAGTIVYDDVRYRQSAIKRLAGQYTHILSQLIANPNLVLERVDLVLPAESQLQLNELSDGGYSPRPFATMNEWLRDTWRKHADRKAVVAEGQSLSYAELDRRTSQLAHFLRDHYSVRPGDLIAVRMGRSAELITALVGILRAGAAFLPMDRSFPFERINYILADSGARLLITDSTSHEPGLAAVPTMVIDELAIQLADMPAEEPEVAVATEHPLYVIYTSGTTGKPKGVVIPHKALVNYQHWFVKAYGICPEDATVLFGSVAFDLSYTSLWSVLLAGGRLHILPDSPYLEPAALIDTLRQSRITYLKLTPSQFELVVKAPDFSIAVRDFQMRLLVLGGETLRTVDVDRYFAHDPTVTFVNHYGPTETTIGTLSCAFKYSDWQGYRRSPTVGRPIANTKAFIAGSDLKLKPRGAVGEICVAGDGLADGYLNRDDLTEERFVEDPFPESGGRLYRTGDLGRWSADGYIEFIGRNDDQIKIRGYRVEPSEVGHVLHAHPDVASGVVVSRESRDGSPVLVGYYIAEKELAHEELRAYLQERLPEYMVPCCIMRIAVLPLTANGKLDASILPEPSPESFAAGQSYVAPRNETEQRLADVWQQLLERERIGTRESFFELGGQSLKAIKLIALVQQEFGVRLEVNDVFNHPTIAELALLLHSEDHERLLPIPAIPIQPDYELTHAQRRLWVIDQMEAGTNLMYNQPRAFLIENEVNVGIIVRAFMAMVERHEILRTVFVQVNGSPRQRVLPLETLDLTVERIDLRDDPQAELRAREIAKREAYVPFDLAKGPLLRAKLIRVDDRKYVFLYVGHHIISDGWSKFLMLHELLRLVHVYRTGTQPPAPPRIQYKDFAAWQNRLLGDGKLRRERDYWLTKLVGLERVSTFPLDRPRHPVKTFNGSTVTFYLGERQMVAIHHLAVAKKATCFMVLVALVKVLLYKYTGNSDIAVGTPIAGRDHPDLEDQLGLYLNTLVLRDSLAGSLSFDQLLSSVRCTTLEAYDNQHFPFDEVVASLQVDRRSNTNPLFEVIVTLQNTDDVVSEDFGDELSDAGLKLQPFAQSFEFAGFDMFFNMRERNGRLHVRLDYNRDVYEPLTVELIAKRMVHIVNQITADPHTTLDDLELDADSEQDVCRALDDWQVNI